MNIVLVEYESTGLIILSTGMVKRVFCWTSAYYPMNMALMI